MIKLLVLVSLLSVAFGHTCLVFPVQRGGLNTSLTIEGADACGKIESPCGGEKPEKQQAVFYSGKTYSVVFQKNLDHYYARSPGFFEIKIGNQLDNRFENLGIIPDSQNIRSLSIISANITIPREGVPGNVLQLIYHTNNPEAPPEFYQCADIDIRFLP